MNQYVIKTVLCSTGERLPVLCKKDTGIPVHSVLLWALTELRATNLASATIQQALRAVMTLHIVLDSLKIDLKSRLNAGQLLTLAEIETLAVKCAKPIEDICEENLSNVRKLGAKTVDPSTTAIRLRYIKGYLSWLVKDRLLTMGPAHPHFSGLQTVAEAVFGAITARNPDNKSLSSLDVREGLTPEELSLLLATISPLADDNPWKNEYAKRRNYLIIRWLLSLGNRRGELLNIKISDVNFQTNELLVARRPDDIVDTRRNQPKVKTKSRLLAIDPALVELTKEFILNDRKKITKARKHEFLWVAGGTGEPLSLSGFNKIFETLREKCPLLPKSLSAHVLRHTWNDLFSAQMDEANISEAQEHKMRTRLMGWSDTSEMVKTYTRRHVKNKAKEASLALQTKLSVESFNAKK